MAEWFGRALEHPATRRQLGFGDPATDGAVDTTTNSHFGQFEFDGQQLVLQTQHPQTNGNHQLSLASDPANSALPKLNLSTQSGSLLLSGQGQWQGSKFQFRGEASAVPEHAAALSNLLNIIGRRQGARSLLSLG